MGVSIQDWPDGETGIRVDIAEDSYILTIGSAIRLQKARLHFVEVAQNDNRNPLHVAGQSVIHGEIALRACPVGPPLQARHYARMQAGGDMASERVSRMVPGITLADWFAAQALTGVMQQNGYDPERNAIMAYNLADAMIALRTERKKQK